MKVVINRESKHSDKDINYNIHKDLSDPTTSFKNIKQVYKLIIIQNKNKNNNNKVH